MCKNKSFFYLIYEKIKTAFLLVMWQILHYRRCKMHINISNIRALVSAAVAHEVVPLSNVWKWTTVSAGQLVISALIPPLLDPDHSHD